MGKLTAPMGKLTALLCSQVMIGWHSSTDVGCAVPVPVASLTAVPKPAICSRPADLSSSLDCVWRRITTATEVAGHAPGTVAAAAVSCQLLDAFWSDHVALAKKHSIINNCLQKQPQSVVPCPAAPAPAKIPL